MIQNIYRVPFIGRPVSGKKIKLPGSKSITNRALILSSLSKDPVTLHNFLFSNDTLYLADALKKLGYFLELDRSRRICYIEGNDPPEGEENLFVGNAGTAMRFLTSFLCLGRGRFRLDGNERMRQRPIQDLVDALNQLGCDVTTEFENRCPPVIINADGIKGGECSIVGKNSSQYISSILMTAPYSKEGITLRVKQAVSEPYIEMTLKIMESFGVKTDREGFNRFRVIPSVYRMKNDYTIEPDASTASYFMAAAAVLGGDVEIQGLSANSIQGDIRFANVLEQMGCRVEWLPNALRLESDGKLRGIDIDMNDIPDMVLTLAVTALFADSPTSIRNVENLRIKESDRLTALSNELNRLGAKVEQWKDGLKITPSSSYQGTLIHTYNDHRIAMAFAIAGLMIEGVIIENPQCVNKTFPEFFDYLEEFIH